MAVVFAATVALGLLAVDFGMWLLGRWSGVRHIHVDVWGWLDFLRQVRAGRIPYVDFWREYPIGAGLFYAAMARFWDPDRAYDVLGSHARVMVVVHGLLAAGVYALTRRPWLALLAGALPTALFIDPYRFDGLCALVTLAAYARDRQGHRLQAVALLSLAVWIKWYPALLLFALLLEEEPRSWWRPAVVFAAVALAVNGPFVVLGLVRHGSLDTFLQPYLFHRDRPLFMDTVLGVATAWLGPLRYERLAAPLSGLAALGLIVAARHRSFATRAVLACVASLAVNRVYSPQFHMWFAPFAAIAAAEASRGRRWIVGTWVAVDVLNVIVFPLLFDGWAAEREGFPLRILTHGFGIDVLVFQAAVLLRSAVLIAFGVAVWRASTSASCRTSSARNGPTSPASDARPVPAR